MKGLILLPQTAFRVWGMNLSPTIFFQEEFIEKYPRDLNSSQSLYQLNRIILEHAGHSVSKVYDRIEQIPLGEDQLVIDCQILNLIHHYKNVPQNNKRIVIDYSNLGHRIVNIQDFLTFNQFVRSLAKIVKFHRRHNISELWSMRSSWESQLIPLSEIFWKNRFLDTRVMEEYAKSFLLKYSFLFEEFKLKRLDQSTLFICPHTDSDINEIVEDLEYLITQDKRAAEIFCRVEQIFIKQHRVSAAILPNTLSLLGRTVVSINNQLTRLLPTEILLLGLEQSYLFSTSSSILFSSNPDRSWSLGRVSTKDRKDYGLMLSRASHAGLEYKFRRRKISIEKR